MGQTTRAGLALLLIGVTLYLIGGESQAREIGGGVAFVAVVLLVVGLVRGD